MNFETLLNNLRPFWPVETALKDIYKKYPERNLSKPQSIECLKDIFDELSCTSDCELMSKINSIRLREDIFFSNDADTELYRHIRYLPAYWHTHSFIEIICVFEGTCTNYIREQEIQMQPGDVCIIAPDTPHCISAFSDASIIINVELRTSTFEKAFFGVLNENDILSDFFTHIIYNSKTHSYIFFRTNGDKELFDYIVYAYAESKGNHLYKARMMNNVIMAFFIILLRKHGSEVILPESDSDENSTDTVLMLKYIQTNYTTVTLSELSAFFNYSERQIQRILKKHTGLNFRSIIQKQKMKQAANLLHSTDLSIAAISESLCYSDVASFRQVFKNYYGVSPAEYRLR